MLSILFLFDFTRNQSLPTKRKTNIIRVTLKFISSYRFCNYFVMILVLVWLISNYNWFSYRIIKTAFPPISIDLFICLAHISENGVFISNWILRLNLRNFHLILAWNTNKMRIIEDFWQFELREIKFLVVVDSLNVPVCVENYELWIFDWDRNSKDKWTSNIFFNNVVLLTQKDTVCSCDSEYIAWIFTDYVEIFVDFFLILHVEVKTSSKNNDIVLLIFEVNGLNPTPTLQLQLYFGITNLTNWDNAVIKDFPRLISELS